jgi:hypothetical protein
MLYSNWGYAAAPHQPVSMADTVISGYKITVFLTLIF